MRCSLGQAWSGGVCTGQAKTYSWDEARVAVRKLNRNGGFGGYTDWELPHIEDLVTIRYCSTGFEYGYTADIPTKAGGIKTIPQTCKGGTNGTYQRPTIDQRIFPNTPNTFVESYWSASPIAADDYSAWSLSFYFGYTFNDGNVKRAQQFVRAVRAAQ
ncbi:MAG: DUF1566 domain-containing protein [Bacteroidetes bacterium]|nr:DUF1566 domain-containing protein [Bacteroidota bacterium]